MEIGVDIESVKRFRKQHYDRNKSFYENIFTDKEIKYCLSKADPYPHFTARFCAKEAVIKAIGGSVYRAKDIEIINDKKGKPFVKLKTKNLKLKTKVLVSLSHTKEYAIAFAIWLN